MTLLAGDGFVVRALTPGDAELLASWRRHPAVRAWYESTDEADAIRAKYFAPERAYVTHAIAERDGEPVGYAQWYACEPAYLAAAGLAGEEGVWALDTHLAPDRIGSGFGHRLVRLLAGHLAATVARRVVIDPECANARAIRAYEKAGFRAVRVMPAYDTRAGAPRDYLLMEWHP